MNETGMTGHEALTYLSNAHRIQTGAAGGHVYDDEQRRGTACTTCESLVALDESIASPRGCLVPTASGDRANGYQGSLYLDGLRFGEFCGHFHGTTGAARQCVLRHVAGVIGASVE